MRLITEFGFLVKRTFTLWWRYLPQVGLCLITGWVFYQAGMVAAAAFGNRYAIWAFISFALGAAAQVLGIIFAILVLKRAMLPARRTRAEKQLTNSGIPSTVFAHERSLDVALLAIGPMLGIYAVWGLVDDMISEAFYWIVIFHGLEVDEWWFSRSADRLPFYVGVGGVALLARIGYGWLTRNAKSSWWRVPMIVLESLWVFSFFLLTLVGVAQLSGWFLRTRLSSSLEEFWIRFLAALPDLSLPFGWTLPQVFSDALIWLTETFLPGIWQGIMLPMMWLALVAVVFGWREFRARDLLSPTLQSRMAPTSQTQGPLQRVINLVVADWREKYLPVFHCFRLIWGSGPYVLGAFLILAALIDLGDFYLGEQLAITFRSGSEVQLYRYFSFTKFVPYLLFTSLSVCLYAATFDRGLADVLERINGDSSNDLPEIVSDKRVMDIDAHVVDAELGRANDLL